MRVSDSHRLLFVHIQKVGGSTIDALLDAEIPDIRIVDGTTRHTPLAGILKHEPELSSYWITGFVRNPWSRMVSWWAMIRDSAEQAAAGNPREIERMRINTWWSRAAEYDFADFLTRGPDEFPRIRRPQVAFLTAGARRADFVGRTETMDADVAAMRARLGLAPVEELPHFNSSPHGDWRDYYTPQLRPVAAELFAKDAAAFGYSF